MLTSSAPIPIAHAPLAGTFALGKRRFMKGDLEMIVEDGREQSTVHGNPTGVCINCARDTHG